MRLLRHEDDGSFSLVEYLGRDVAPAYAILSHTWGPDHEEVNFRDLTETREYTAAKAKAGYQKLTFCANQATQDGLRYFWVDTCCINKSDAAELQEAINSMFRWYQNSTRCYVYLTDVSHDTSVDNDRSQRWKPEFRQSRWFTRGWTLQQLIAPKSVEFFSKQGTLLGNKGSLEQTIHEITGVAVQAIRGDSLAKFSEVERLSWASKRQTKREEDIVYCLLGFFDVFMPLIYGEGRQNAKERLQEQIRKKPDNGEESLHDEQKRILQDSLRFEQIDARHMTIKNAHARTCKWLLNSPEYLEWLDPTQLSKHHGFLWIKGKPGTGKSTLMKFALANARRNMSGREVIAFFFNARGEHLEKSTVGTYRSLLLQLLEKFPHLICVFDSLGLSSKRISTGHEWSVESLEILLEHTLKILEKPVVCFIDALDECDEQQIRAMVSLFERVGELVASSEIRFRICFSSRHYPHITIRKGIDLILEGQEGHDQDITNYIQNELKIGKSKLAKQIRNELQEKASGIFMWVVLVVGILNKEHDGGRIHTLRRRLQEIPSDLHKLFRDILTRDSNNKPELLLCIQWVLFARQPLSPTELYYAILSGVELEALSEWDKEELTPLTIERFILDSSKGLTDITSSKVQKVQFIHESVRDFLLKENGLSSIWPELGNNFTGQSHDRLKQCCLNYIRPDVLAPVEIVQSQSENLVRGEGLSKKEAAKQAATQARLSTLDRFPFLGYSVKNVLHHADAAEGYGVTQNNLQSFPLDCWVKCNNIIEIYEVRRYTERVTLLYLLAERDLGNLIKVWPSILECLEVGTERHGPPAFASVVCGSNSATQTFVEALRNQLSLSNRLDPSLSIPHNEKSGDQKTKRKFIFSRKKTLVLQAVELESTMLLASILYTGRYDMDSKDSDGLTPLWWASKYGSTAVVRFLISTGKVEVDAENEKYHGTPLTTAIDNGHENVAEVLLRTHSINVNRRTVGVPLLYKAVEMKMDNVVKTLLSYGAKVNAQGGSFGNALQIASYSGDEEMVKLFLAAGADVNAQGGYHGNALQAASYSDSGEVVKLLLSVGAEVNAQGGHHDNALQAASHGGHDEIVELLLAAGAEVNAKGERYGNALHIASYSGYKEVVKLLLSAGAEINAQGGHYGTALQAASLKDYSESLTLLRRDLGRMNSLINVVHNDHVEVVELLLSAGADVNAQGGKFGSALRAASKDMYSSSRIRKLLTDAGAVDEPLVDTTTTKLPLAPPLDIERTIQELVLRKRSVKRHRLVAVIYGYFQSTIPHQRCITHTPRSNRASKPTRYPSFPYATEPGRPTERTVTASPSPTHISGTLPITSEPRPQLG